MEFGAPFVGWVDPRDRAAVVAGLDGFRAGALMSLRPPPADLRSPFVRLLHDGSTRRRAGRLIGCLVGWVGFGARSKRIGIGTNQNKSIVYNKIEASYHFNVKMYIG